MAEVALELSMGAIVERLEAQIAFHREREAFHAEQETHHREQRALHASELESLTSNLAAFKASAAKLVSIALRRMYAAGKLREVRRGTSRSETLYAQA